MSEPHDKREEVELPTLPESVLMRMRNENNSGCYHEATREALYGRERQLRAALAANQENHAALNSALASLAELPRIIAEINQAHEAELSSLRASAGEKWIDVKQGLPAEGKNVLVFTPYWCSFPFVAYWEQGEWHGERILSRPNAVTHWMPLPAPPTKDKE